MELLEDRRYLRVKNYLEDKTQSKFYFSDKVYLCKIFREILASLKFNHLNKIEREIFVENPQLKEQNWGNQLKRYVLLNLETEPKFKQNPAIYKHVKEIIEINSLINDILIVLDEQSQIVNSLNQGIEKE